jgi:hypothetical protein
MLIKLQNRENFQIFIHRETHSSNLTFNSNYYFNMESFRNSYFTLSIDMLKNHKVCQIKEHSYNY